MTWTDEQAAAYLAGMIDGEGSVSDPDRPSHRGGRSITIVNNDRELIDACVEACEQLGVKGARVYAYPHRKSITLYIGRRENLETVLARVPLRSDRKRDRLERLISGYAPAPGRGFYHYPTKEAL